MVDDEVTLKVRVQEMTAESVLNEKLPNLLFYKNCIKESIFRNRMDMILDFSGSDKERKIAVSLTLSTGGTHIGKPNGAIKNLIRKFKKAKKLLLILLVYILGYIMMTTGKTKILFIIAVYLKGLPDSN